MKHNLLYKIASLLIKIDPIKIAIVDDQRDYFNKKMISIAKEFGYTKIERYYNIDADLLRRFKIYKYDIFIFDIKGIVEKSIGKNGFDVASLLHRKTSAYIVITSAHKFNLSDLNKEYDYVIHDRLLTAIDFVKELDTIVFNYFHTKLRFYRKLFFKLGFKLMRISLNTD